MHTAIHLAVRPELLNPSIKLIKDPATPNSDTDMQPNSTRCPLPCLGRADMMRRLGA
jgi:hypothetical protein